MANPDLPPNPAPNSASNPDPEHYTGQLQQKVLDVEQQFANFSLPVIEVFTSPPLHYRLRAEFKIWHEGGRAQYAMYRQGEYKKPYVIENFTVAARLINHLMPPLLAAINASDTLRRRLFSVEFLTTLSGQALITLLYHRALDTSWEQQATTLGTQLNANIIGRSRKQKVVITRDYVMETLRVEGMDYAYQQIESGFTQPNGRVNEKMIGWALDKSRNFGGDLLELYCGNGNFTVPMAKRFTRVLATEIAKISVNSALFNLTHNGVANVTLVRMSSAEIAQALLGVRPFRRLQHVDLDSYQFSTIFVDPPRAGLDDPTIDLVRRFDNIIYVSCNPTTLHANLVQLAASHRIADFAVFDQFPYTPHLECGVVLKKY